MAVNDLATNASALQRTKIQSEKCQKKYLTLFAFFCIFLLSLTSGAK